MRRKRPRARDTGDSPSKLDALDETIIEHLRDDGTIPHRKLARLCGSSEPTVRRRIARLRRDDVIKIVAVADPFKQGYPVVAILNMQIDQTKADEVKAAVSKMKELRFVGITLGNFDVVAEAWFRSVKEMLHFTSNVLTRVPGVARVEPLQIYELVTYAYDWGKAHSGQARPNLPVVGSRRGRNGSSRSRKVKGN